MDRRLDPTTALGGPVVAPARVEGVVRWFSPDRGFGYLSPRDGGDDVFVTWAAVPGDGFRCLQAGQTVSWSPALDEHGPVAGEVQVLSGV